MGCLFYVIFYVTRIARLSGLLSILILPAIGEAASNTDLNESTGGLRNVRVQLKWTHQFQFAGYYAAIEQGYYREAGLDVELIEYAPGVTPIDQLMGGRVEFSIADTGALLYQATGVPLVALAAIFQNSPSILISLADSPISELADLENKRAMLSGGFMNAELMSMLQSVGIDSAEIELVPSDTSIDVLVEGRTDAYNGYTTNEPYLLNQLGVPFRIFMPRDYGVDFYGDILITNEAIIAAEPRMVNNFLAATLRGWRYAAENPEAVVDLILEQYNTQNKTREHLLFEAQEAINDKFGHAAGDEALRCAGQLLVKIKRRGDLAARIGGEEFVLVCMNSNQKEIRKLAARLCREMENTPISHAGENFRITCSIGLAEYESGDDVESILRRADLALYDAKQSGRNRIVTWQQAGLASPL